MSREGDIGDGGGGDFGATEEMPTAGPRSSRRRAAAAPAVLGGPPGTLPASRPSEPLQLARGESSGEREAAYATGPKPIPPSRQNVGSDPAPAVIVDGAQAHTYEATETPPPSSSHGGLYLAPVPAFPSAPEPRRTGTMPMAPAFAAAQFAAPVPTMRKRTRSETVVITMPEHKGGPSSKEKVLAFVVVLVIVALLGIIFLLWHGLGHRGGAAVSPDPATDNAAVAPVATTSAAPEHAFVPPPPMRVVGAPDWLDAGKKTLKKH